MLRKPAGKGSAKGGSAKGMTNGSPDAGEQIVPGEDSKQAMFQTIWGKSKTNQHNGRLAEVEQSTTNPNCRKKLKTKPSKKNFKFSQRGCLQTWT
eukprot:5025189-Karenia_brevis.AAC.1